jgi:glutaminyl-peptide cyclotransferase
MSKLGWQVEVTPFTDSTPFGKKTFANVVATYPIGRNFKNQQHSESASSRHAKNRVVFACHYDSKFFKDMEFIGAVDSAVPCAILLDMAKFLHENFDKSEFHNVCSGLKF